MESNNTTSLFEFVSSQIKQLNIQVEEKKPPLHILNHTVWKQINFCIVYYPFPLAGSGITVFAAHFGGLNSAKSDSLEDCLPSQIAFGITYSIADFFFSIAKSDETNCMARRII